MFAFFPWLTIEDDGWNEDLTFGRFSLLPYQRGVSPAGPSTPAQDLIDATLKHYLKYRGRDSQPVSTATLIAVDGNLEFDHSDRSLVNELFAFKEVVAFAGLAIRSPAWQEGGSHCNSTCFEIEIQGQYNPKFGVTRISRQYGGSHISFFVGEVHCPHFADQFTGIRLDAALIKALWKIHSPDRRSRMETAIRLFNAANTDSDQKSFYEELMEIVSAMEYLLEVRGSKKGHALGVNLERDFRPSSGTPRIPRHPLLSNGGLRKKYRRALTVLGIWAWDLYIWRDYFAHGEIMPDTGKVAQERHHILEPEEHLVLANFAFPRLVKAMLERQKAYTLTEDDRDEIDLFEHLIVLDFDQLAKQLKDDQPNIWDKAVEDFKGERETHRMVARYRKALDNQGLV